MKFTAILGASAMAFSFVSAGGGGGYNPICDSCALLSITLKICDADIYIDGHFDPIKACTCWNNCKGDPSILGYQLDLVQEAFDTCLCIAYGL